MAVCGVGLVFAEGLGAVRDDADGVEAEEFPVHFEGPAGGDAGFEVAN